MSSHFRIVNLTNGFTYKRRHIERAIFNCAVAWVEEGVSVRNLTLAEAIQARNEQAKRREPLEYAEIHGLKYEPSASGAAATRRENKLVWAAHAFASKAA